MFTVEDFFKVLEYLKTGVEDPSIPPEIRQLAQNAKLNTKQFFEKVLDQVTYNSNDYNRIRALLIDWYSAGKTFQDLSKGTTDAFSLPNTLLNIASRSFGFPYADGIGSRVDKALFLYSLAELYKIKGSPRSLKSVLEFFGIYDIQIFEWWIKNDPVLDQLYFESSYVDLGGINPETLEIQKVPYDQFTLDSHWWYTEPKIKLLNESLPIKLPSITPYFSIQASASLDKITQIYSVISRQISDQYTTFVNDNTLNQTIFADVYGQNLSLLELVLTIGYTYNTWSSRTYGSDSTAYIHYTGTEESYDVIIDEYNNIVRRPSSRDDQKTRIEMFNESFTKDQLLNFLTSSSDTGVKLEFINPDLKEWIDEKFLTPDVIENMLGQFLRELDIFIRMEYGIQALSFEQMMLGTDADDIVDVINFFKPKRARLLAFNLVYAIDDPLFNSVILADTLYNRIRQWDEEQYYYFDKLVNTRVTQWDEDFLFRTEGGTGPNSMGWDSGNIFDSKPMNITDALYTIIRQWQQEQVTLSDRFTIPYIGVNFHEYGRPQAFDRCGIFDTRMQAWDCLHTIQFVERFHDRAYMCRHMPFDRGDNFDQCGRIADPLERNKTFDSGFMFDVDGFPVDKTFDEGFEFDETSGLFIPWWKEGPDPEYVCTCDTFRYETREVPKDTITVVDDPELVRTIIGFSDTLEQEFAHFDMGATFDETSYFYRDTIKERIMVNFSDQVMDAIRGFDQEGLFDQYSTLLKDTLDMITTTDIFKDTVSVVDQLGASITIPFGEFMFETVLPTNFDSGFVFDSYSSMIHDEIQIVVNSVPPP